MQELERYYGYTTAAEEIARGLETIKRGHMQR
jgi:hypothetical protein